MRDITQLLHQIDEGDSNAAEQLLPLVYDELRNLAAVKMADERSDHTLQPTALVHEAYVRLVDSNNGNDWHSRGHFFGAAAEAMRRLLVENARRKQRLRHGGANQRIPMEMVDLPHIEQNQDLLALDEALNTLDEEDHEICQLVKLRYFTGMTIEQAASALGISARTANRYWAYAKARLFQEVSK